LVAELGWPPTPPVETIVERLHRAAIDQLH
jgi:hypothetical protein